MYVCVCTYVFQSVNLLGLVAMDLNYFFGRKNIVIQLIKRLLQAIIIPTEYIYSYHWLPVMKNTHTHHRYSHEYVCVPVVR